MYHHFPTCKYVLYVLTCTINTNVTCCNMSFLLQLSAEFTELLISDCLSVAVPYSRKHLDEFDIVKADTDALHKDLVKLGMNSSIVIIVSSLHCVGIVQIVSNLLTICKINFLICCKGT